MINHSDSIEEAELILLLKIQKLEIRKHIEIIEVLNENRRIQWPTFFLSLFFVFFVWIVLSMNRTWADNFFVTEIIVNFSFNLVFTFGFSYALLYLLNFKQFAELFSGISVLGGAENKKNNQLFILNIAIGFILTMLFSMALYHLWVRGDSISPLIDLVILCAIFIHMLLGLKCWHTIRKVKKISKENHRVVVQLIDEFELLYDVTNNKGAETNEAMVK